MSEARKCRHRKLTFGSGGWYIFCADECNQSRVPSPRADGSNALVDLAARDLETGLDYRIEPHLLERLALAAQDPEDAGRVERPEDLRS